MQKRCGVTHEIRTQSLQYVLAAFGFVAGLAWNDAIKSLIDAVFPIGANSIAAKFGYAAIVTALVIAATRVGAKVARETDE